MSGAEAALRAARLGDEVVHGFGLMGMVAGALIGAAIAAAIIVAGVATGGLAIVAIVGGCIAGGGLAGGALARGIMKAADLPGPTTGTLAAAGPSRVTVNSRMALRAGMDFSAGCSGAPMNHFTMPAPVLIAEGSQTVTINGRPMARQSMKLACGAKIKAGSDNVTVGGPTVCVIDVTDYEEMFETGLQVLGFVALGAAGLGALAAGVGATLVFGGVVGGSMLGMEALHSWGESLGPGYGDIMVGTAGFALMLGGAKLSISPKGASRKVNLKEFDRIYEKAPQAKLQIDALAESLAKEAGGKVAKAPIKSRERALEKIENDYTGDSSQIKDLARNTVVVPEEQIAGVASKLEAAGAKVKTINAMSDELGYSGVNTTIKTESGLTGEVQVNSPGMIYAKERPEVARAIIGDDAYSKLAKETGLPGGKGHEYYEQWRKMDAGSPEAKAIARESRAYYETIRRAARGS